MNEYLKERELWWPVSPELMASYKDGSQTETNADGKLQWLKNDKLHRDGDQPAIIYADGSLLWYKNGLLHRDGDLPAYIATHGSLVWYKNGLLHRDSDKPAYIATHRKLIWYKNDKKHRTTGPAVINQNKKKEYWVNDLEITSEVESWLKTRKYKAPFTPEQQVEFTLTFS
jgi:hypothetical protein